MSYLKDIISGFLKKKGYEVKKTVNTQLLLENVFQTQHERKVLISYLTTPFTNEINFSHTNLTECYTAAEIFRDLAYNVDVIDLNDSMKLDYSAYDVIYGMGNMYEESFQSSEQEKFKKIYYGTGNSPFFYYKEAGKKLHQFYKNKKKLLPESVRLIGSRSTLALTNSDVIICLGNDFCKQTYIENVPYLPTYNLNAFYFDVIQDKISRDVSTARNHFLWFGSGGLISKGLSDCIDFFSKNPDMTLHICGASKVYEKRFWEMYSPIVEQCDNIIDHGFAPLKSEKFATIVSQCLFAIFPSVSEGGSPALLNLMANGGIIPIATEACSVDVDKFGFILEDSSVESIAKTIGKLQSVSDQNLDILSTETQKYVRENYTLDIYRKNLFEIIKANLE
ncbi:hypothetical protein PQ459_02095 [Chryseobacterium sp. KACC 21268]|nr:hypothetical protein PQ459_02095 [Chryseobacterium sp. KACC 21268]